MKITPLFLVILPLLTGCNSYRPCEDEVVCEAYVHRYGVPLEANDWSARGQHGQKVETRKNGVVVTKSFESGILQGDCTYTFPHHDTIARKESYNQGNLVQECVYHSNGIPLRQVSYDSPTAYSVIVWYESGAPQCREGYENGRLAQGEYYNIANHVESQVDQCNGLRTLRDDLGQLLSVDTIRDGEMVLRTTYHANGAPATVSSYANGKIEGEKRTYLPGGEPATIETWNNDQQHGLTVVYEYGEKASEVPYVSGCKHGVERRYRNGTVLVQETTWEKDQRQGPCYSYVGNVPKVDWYYGDRMVNKLTYDMLRNQ